MGKLPVSFFSQFDAMDEGVRRCFFREMALNGAKHLVLTATMITAIMNKPGLKKQLESEMKEAGLSFADSHAPYGPLWDMSCNEKDERSMLKLRQKISLETAAYFKVSTMTFHMGLRKPENTPEEYLALISDFLDDVLPYAAKLGITLCIENGFAWRGAPETLFAVKERYPGDELGFCFDAGHANMTTQPETLVKSPLKTEEILERMLPHVVNCHIHDNDGMHDRHTLPGRGCAGYDKIVPLLKKAPRLQVVQSEVLHLSNCVAVKELVETFDRLFN